MNIQNPFQKIEDILQRSKVGSYFLCGIPGMGKTEAALDYCGRHTESLYFSFQHLDPACAPVIFAGRCPDILGSCGDWQSFFTGLNTYAKEKCPTIFLTVWAI